MVEKGKQMVFYMDTIKAEKTYFKEATKAVEFLLSQLNAVKESEIFSKEFAWSGDECTVPASTLNTVLRSLETLGVQDLVAIFPAVNDTVVKKYIIKPFLYNPECCTRLGLAVNVVNVRGNLTNARDVQDIKFPESLTEIKFPDVVGSK